MKREPPMNWDQMEGAWKQRKGKAVHKWGEMMDDELASAAGKYEELIGAMQESYGIAKEAIEHQKLDLKDSIAHLKKSNAELATLQKALNAKDLLSKQTPGTTLLSKKMMQTKAHPWARPRHSGTGHSGQR